MDPELSILLPVRNEAINIPIMLKLLSAVVETPHEVLIIYDHPDDNSLPATLAIQAKYPHLRLIYNDLGGGVINALRKGVQAAQGEYILVSCVDEVGLLLAIDDMVALMHRGCDLVSGTRYRWGGRRLGGSIFGSLFSAGANMLFHLCGSVFTDATTGLKMFKRSCFWQLNLESKPIGWVVAFEISIKSQLQGLKLGEVPVLSLDRLYGGQSTFQLRTWLIEYLKWFFWGIGQLRSQNQYPKIMVRIPAATPPSPKSIPKSANVILVLDNAITGSNEIE